MYTFIMRTIVFLYTVHVLTNLQLDNEGVYLYVVNFSPNYYENYGGHYYEYFIKSTYSNNYISMH